MSLENKFHNFWTNKLFLINILILKNQILKKNTYSGRKILKSRGHHSFVFHSSQKKFHNNTSIIHLLSCFMGGGCHDTLKVGVFGS